MLVKGVYPMLYWLMTFPSSKKLLDFAGLGSYDDMVGKVVGREGRNGEWLGYSGKGGGRL